MFNFVSSFSKKTQVITFQIKTNKCDVLRILFDFKNSSEINKNKMNVK